MTNRFDAICLVAVAHKDESVAFSKEYGTGFFIHENEWHTYIATCAHVVKSAYLDKESLEVFVNGSLSTITAYDQDADIAILQSNKVLSGSKILPISNRSNEGERIQIVGISALAGDRMKRGMLTLEGSLVRESAWSISGETKIPTWRIRLDDSDFKLQVGYSGAPVISVDQGSIIGMISHKMRDGSTGIMVSTSVLKSTWSDFSKELLMPSENTYAQQKSQKSASPLLEHYQKTLDDKNDQLEIINQIINRIEKARLYETSVATQISLEAQIEERKEISKKITLEINDLNDQIDSLD